MPARGPRYGSRARYRTRRSASERVALDPARDFGATALDRPRVDPSMFPPRSIPALEVHWLDQPGVVRRLAAAVLLACGAMGATLGALAALAAP